MFYVCVQRGVSIQNNLHLWNKCITYIGYELSIHRDDYVCWQGCGLISKSIPQFNVNPLDLPLILWGRQIKVTNLFQNQLNIMIRIHTLYTYIYLYNNELGNQRTFIPIYCIYTLQ